jgi:hypothetical protein
MNGDDEGNDAGAGDVPGEQPQLSPIGMGYTLERAQAMARRILPLVQNIDEASALAVQSCPQGAFYVFVPANVNPHAFLTELAVPGFVRYKSSDPSGRDPAFGSFKDALDATSPRDNHPYQHFLVLDSSHCIIADVVNREGRSALLEAARREYHQAVVRGLAAQGRPYQFTYEEQIARDLRPLTALEGMVEQ